MLQQVARYVIIAGAFILVLGVVLWVLGRLGVGKLPGDLSFGGKNWKVYLPIGTCILMSVLLTLLFYLLRHWRK